MCRSCFRKSFDTWTDQHHAEGLLMDIAKPPLRTLFRRQAASGAGARAFLGSLAPRPNATRAYRSSRLLVLVSTETLLLPLAVRSATMRREPKPEMLIPPI